MRYCPISVRLTPTRPTHAPQAASGCFIDTGSSQFCITVCHFPVSELSNYRIHVAAPHVGEDVIWVRARIIDSLDVFSENSNGNGGDSRGNGCNSRESGNSQSSNCENVDSRNYGKSQNVDSKNYGNSQNVDSKNYGNSQNVDSKNYGNSQNVDSKNYSNSQNVDSRNYGSSQRNGNSQKNGNSQNVDSRNYGNSQNVDSKIYGNSQKNGISQNFLGPFLQSLLLSGFQIFPTNSISGGSLKNISVVQMEASVQDTLKNGLAPFRLGQAQPLSQLTVQSNPFGLTSPKLFANFRSTGGVCAVFADGYLSDCRYLENMIGGVVSSQDEAMQVGLVVGNLRKMNGDGDLTVVLALPAISRLFPKQEIIPKNSSFPQTARNPSSNTVDHRIRPLLLSSKKSSSWGSCVVYNESTLVTNYHVIQPLLEDSTVSCKAIFDDQIVTISRDQVVVPFKELDLAFVALHAGTLTSGNFFQLQTSTRANRAVELFGEEIKPFGEQFGEVFAEKLTAVGYGLFLNKNLKPLRSTGTVCRTIKIPPFLNSSQAPIPSLMITSTTCWNGSSGGGIFDTQGDFVGLISSNAQVYIPEVADKPPNQKTEKVPSFCFTIPAELIALCYEEKVVRSTGVELSEQVINAWGLKDYYKESIQHEAKM